MPILLLSTKALKRRSAMRLVYWGFGFVAMLAADPASATGRSIVGFWTPQGAKCQLADGEIRIGPLGITGDDFQCAFKSVARVGETVIWKGKCGFPEDDKPAIVVAQTQGQLLRLTINGGINGPYRQCPSNGIR